MTREDSIHLPTPEQVIESMLRQHSRTSALFRRWGKILTAAGGGGALIIAVLAAREILASPTGVPTLGLALAATVGLAITLTVALAGTSVWVSGSFLRSDLNHHQAAQYDRDRATKSVKDALAEVAGSVKSVEDAQRRHAEAEEAIRREIRAAGSAQAVALGELTAELQANRQLIRQLEEKITENERQRQSDFDQIREASRKAIEGLHQDVERLRATITAEVAEAVANAASKTDRLMEMVKARDEAYADRLKAVATALGARLAQERQAIAADVAEVVSRAQHEAFAAGMKSAYDEIAAAGGTDEPDVVSIETARMFKRVAERLKDKGQSEET